MTYNNNTQFYPAADFPADAASQSTYTYSIGGALVQNTGTMAPTGMLPMIPQRPNPNAAPTAVAAVTYKPNDPTSSPLSSTTSVTPGPFVTDTPPKMVTTSTPAPAPLPSTITTTTTSTTNLSVPQGTTTIGSSPAAASGIGSPNVTLSTVPSQQTETLAIGTGSPSPSTTTGSTMSSGVKVVDTFTEKTSVASTPAGTTTPLASNIKL